MSAAAASSASAGVSLDAFRWRLALTKEDLSSERVSCIAAAPGLAYVGCEAGTLLAIAIQTHAQAASGQPAIRMMGKRKMGKKAVQQIEVVYVRDATGSSSGSGGTAMLLLALVDSKLLLLDAHSLATVLEVGPKDSFSLFSIDQSSSSPGSASLRVCASMKSKKKLQLFSVTTFKAECIKEMVVPDTVLAMVASREMVALGYKREYSLLSLTTDAPTDVPVPVEGISPLMAQCGPNELLLATNNSLGFFVSFSGDPLPKAPLVWQQVPTIFAQCGGFIVAAMTEPAPSSKEPPTIAVAIASLMDQKQVQSVRLPSKLPSGSSSASTAVHLATHAQADLVLIGVSSTFGSEVFVFTQTSTNEQIEQYLEAGLALEAASLFATLQPKKAQSDEFNTRAGWIALRECDFTHAFDFFLRSTTDPRDLIQLFPDLQLKALPWSSSASQAKELGSITQLVDQAKARQAALPPQQRKKDTSDLMAQSSSALVRQARTALASYLWTCRKERLGGAKPGEEEIAVWVDTALLFLLVEHETWRKQMQTAVSNAAAATGSRGSFSAATGGSLLGGSSPDHAHVEPLPYTLQQLLFPSNSCLLHESELFLSREKWYLSLAGLGQSKGLLRKALEVWRNLGEGRFQAQDPEGILSPNGGTPAKGKGTSAQSPNRVPGLQETVALLSTLGDTPLLWEFAEWVLHSSPSEGLKAFLTPRPSSTGESAALPPERVLNFLKKVQDQAKAKENQERHGGVEDGFTVVPAAGSAAARSSSTTPVDLQEAYLEYLIQHERTKDSKYHTALALCYLGKVVKLSLVSASGSAGARSTGGRFKPGHEPGARGAPRLKLMRFLQRSEEYDAAAVLQQLVELSAKASLDFGRPRAPSVTTHAPLSWTGPPIPTPGGATYCGLDPTKHEANLYEELLLLLSRLGRHTRVLQIYIFDLKDEAGASRYAEYICHKQAEEQEERRSQQRRAAAHASLDVNADSPASAVAPSTPMGRSDERHPGDVFLELLEIYFSDEYAAMWRERQEALSDKERKQQEKDRKTEDGRELPKPQPTDAALALLNEFFHLMDPVSLLRILPPTLPLASLSHLFSRLFPSTLHARRHGRLVAGLHKMVHLRTQSHCFLLRSISLYLDSGTKCSWCYKALSDAVFVAHPLHTLRDPITQQFVIDFERGGTAPVSAPGQRDPLDEETGFMNELPRFVLVHYQCSAAFLANGGVEAFQGGGGSAPADGSRSRSNTRGPGPGSAPSGRELATSLPQSSSFRGGK